MEQKTSSVVSKDTEQIETSGQMSVPTWGLIGFLVACFILLKLLIYKK